MDPVEHSGGTYFEGAVRITYDIEADAAYVYLTPDDDEDNSAELRQVVIEDSLSDSEIILDVEDGRTLHGIEILGASACLPPDLIQHLRRLRDRDDH